MLEFLFWAGLFLISTFKRIMFSYLAVCILWSLLQVKWPSENVIINTHTLPWWGCSSLFPYAAITEIRDASTVALSWCTRSPMTLSQSHPPMISHQTSSTWPRCWLGHKTPTQTNKHQTAGSPETSTLWHTYRYPHSRTRINTPSFPEQSYIGMPSQPSYYCFLPWHSLVMLCAR